MKRMIPPLVALMLILSSGPDTAVALSRRPAAPDHVPGQVLVKFRPEVPQERIDAIIQGEGASVLKVIRRSGIYLLSLPDGMTADRAVARFSAVPEVQYAEPNFKAQPLEEQ